MTQIKKKWIGDNEIGSNQIQIEKNQALRGLNQSDIEIDLLKINTAGKAEILGKEVVSLEEIAIEAVVYVEKGGDNATANGSLARPFSTIMGALGSITDASVTKRYVIKVAPGAYSETNLKLKAGVFIVGESRDSVRITSSSTITLDSSFSGSGDHRSGFQQCIVISACDFDWSAVTSAAGKLFFNEVSFSSTVRMYGHNNAIAQAQFNSCTFFAKLTVSGINVGTHTNCFHFSTIDLLQHPNGGMATILNAAGGNAGSILIQTTANDFSRRCSLFARNFFCDGMTVDGPSSYADGTISSFPKTGATKVNGGNVVQLNEISHGRFAPNESNAHNLGDWGKQWAWHFAYVHATTGTDMYLGTYPTSFGADSVGKSVYIMPDLAGLQENADGGNIVLATAAVSGTGVKGKVEIAVRELDMGGVKITDLANGVDAQDAVTKSQLDSKLDASLKGAVNGVAELDEAGKVPASQLPSYVDDVLEFADLASFPAEGESSKIYVAIDSSKVYRWSGSVYVEISASPGSTDAVVEGSTNLYFTDERAQDALEDSLALKADQSSLAAVEETVGIHGMDIELLLEKTDTLETNLASEVSTREAPAEEVNNLTNSVEEADNNLQTYINEVQTNLEGITGQLQADVAQEIIDREAGDDTLQQAIDAGLATKLDASLKGVPGGVAELDEAGKVPASQLPSYVDDVLEYADLATFPAEGESSKIYIAMDSGKTYRWSGSIYVEISASPGSTDAVTEGSLNLYFTDERAQAAVSLQSSYETGSTITTTEEVGPVVVEGGLDVTTLNVGDYTEISIMEPALGVAGKVEFNSKEFVVNATVTFEELESEETLARQQFDLSILPEGGGGVPEKQLSMGVNPGGAFMSAQNSTFSANMGISLSPFDAGSSVYMQGVDSNVSILESGVIELKHAPDQSINLAGSTSGAISLIIPAEISVPYAIRLPSYQAEKAGQVLVNEGDGYLYWGNNSFTQVDDEASFPAEGEDNKLYITRDNDKLWYYKDGVYAEVSPSLPFNKEKLVLTETDIDNQYVDLQHHVKHESINAYANRLAIHETDDYDLSVVSNKTRVSFAGDIATGGASALIVGDVLYINYVYPGA